MLYAIAFRFSCRMMNLWERIHNKIQQKHCIVGSNSKIYRQSNIINMSNKKDHILIGSGTHIRGELLVYPYRGKYKLVTIVMLVREQGFGLKRGSLLESVC